VNLNLQRSAELDDIGLLEADFLETLDLRDSKNLKRAEGLLKDKKRLKVIKIASLESNNKK
jgi:hypothetical protein